MAAAEAAAAAAAEVMRVCVLAGGPGGERAVSLRSGEAVLGALSTLGWPALAVTLGGAPDPSPIGPDGARAIDDAAHTCRWETRGPGGEGPSRDGTPPGAGDLLAAFGAIRAWRPDVVFIAMHGAWGEDGRVQGLLDMLGLPYQGSGALSSALAMDKVRAKEVFRAHGLPVAADRVMRGLGHLTPEALGERARQLVVELGLPLVLKTPGSGSSVGVAVVDTEAEVGSLLSSWSTETDTVLAEAFVPGREFTCPVVELQPGAPEALPTVEIRPRAARFFDYEAKYDPGATDELCPAPIPPELEARLRAIGLAAHVALGCRHVSRTDVRVRDDGSLAVLETNTLPGLTPASLLPKSAAARGLGFPDLVATLVRAAARSGRG
jgi:D-alanine-D-alanine ligase